VERPRTRRQLWGFISIHFGIDLPWKVFTPGHSSPFDFVAEGFFHPRRDVLAWANRRGIKTLAASILAALEYRFFASPVKGRVLAGSEDQARTLYEYWQQWCWGLLRDRLAAEPGRLITRLDNGDFEILAASPKRVRGPGIQRLFWDEVDEIDPSILAASIGTLTSLHGVAARVVGTSTWHQAHGPMGELVASAEAKGFSLHKWNIWESIARCPPERHGHGRGCQACKLGPACLGKARQIDPRARVGVASQACGLFAVDDAVKQYSQWSARQWAAEAECQRPAMEGLVYPQFDRRVHVAADVDFDENLPIFRTIDWGLNDFVCLWLQADKHGRTRVVDEYWSTQATVAQNAKAVAARDAGTRVEATYCDPAGRSRSDQTGYSDIDVFAAHGIRCTYTLAPWARQVGGGINLIRAALVPAAGPPRFFVAGACEKLIKAFESYRLRQVNGEYLDEPIKPQACDHPMDALRYYFVNRHGPVRAQAKPLGYTG